MAGEMVFPPQTCLPLDASQRRAIVLCDGDKSGGGEKRFYRQLIRKADERFDAHLAKMKAAVRAALKQKGKKR
jgi:hypothetical protein